MILFCLLIGTVGCSSKPVAAKNELKAGTNTFKIGDTFNVVLSGNPSTGFAWYYTIDNNDIIQLSSSSDVPDQKNAVGSASTYTWTFKALQAGQTKIVYLYYQSWLGEETATKENTIEYLITVEP